MPTISSAQGSPPPTIYFKLAGKNTKPSWQQHPGFWETTESTTLGTGYIHINIAVWDSALQKGISWDTPLKPPPTLYPRDVSSTKLTWKRYSKSILNGLGRLVDIQSTQVGGSQYKDSPCEAHAQLGAPAPSQHGHSLVTSSAPALSCPAEPLHSLAPHLPLPLTHCCT